MTPEEIARIEAHQRELRDQLGRLDSPKMLLEGDNEYCEIVGNEAAFICLAIDSLEVARRRNQALNMPISGRDIPVQINGLKFDPNPELQEVIETPWWGKFAAYGIVAFLATVFMVGIVNSMSWAQRLISGWLRH